MVVTAAGNGKMREMTFSEVLRAQPKWRILAIGLILVGILGAIDLVTPFELTLFMFYTCPILFVAWYGDRKSAIFLAVLSAFVWWCANRSTQPFTAQSFAWSAVNRVVLLSIVAAGGAAMATQREALRARVAALERTRELEEEILRVSEREKMRIGQDLHDGLCQHLAAIDCAVECLKLDLEEKELPEADAAAFIQKQLTHSIVEARELARGIFPVQMNEEGLLVALDELVSTTNRLRQISVQLSVRGDIRIKEPQVGMHLFRIAQEALSNAGKHAHASQVRIDLANEDQMLTMTVTDDGKGLPVLPTHMKGLGLQTMNYRARSLGGTLDITPVPEGGTMVRCAVRMAA
jgi:signal transduction histidine kinase